MTFAKRLIAGTLLVLFFTVSILVWTAERSLREDLEADVARALEREARLVREALPTTPDAWPATLRRLTADDGHDIELIAMDGRLVAASDPNVQLRLAAELSRSDAPDVRAALAGGTGQSVERLGASRQPIMYVSVPGGPGAIRLSAPLDLTDQTMSRAQNAVLGAAFLALVLGSILAWLAARSVAQPLTAITAAANAIAQGAPPRFPRSGIPDIDGLVQALRQMHRQLADRFDELRSEQAESAALVEAMVEGVIAADRRGRIVTANAAARLLLGYEPDEALPGLTQLFRVKAARELVDAVLQGTAIQNRQLDLDDRTVLVNARSLPAGGAVIVLHDLTEVRRLEAVRRDFVANVSHELKTPLTSISGYAETLLGDHPDAVTTARFLEIIVNNARRMQRLVDDLLDLSRIEAGRWQPKPEPVDLELVAREVWATLAERARGRGVTLDTTVPADGLPLFADPDAVRQILTNLFDNSLRHTPTGGTITLEAHVDGDETELAVTDTGAGIPREHLGRIFERFYRVDPSRSRDEGGTGLGLAIVKHLVEAHGGRVGAESELGLGTTIRCWFPAAPIEAPVGA